MPKVKENSYFNFSIPISYNGLRASYGHDAEALNRKPITNL
jgi:hypothetical protein